MQENKETLSADTIMHIEYEEVNKEMLYAKAFEEMGENATEENKEKFRDLYRHYYFATDIYPNSHSLEFFDEILKEIYPSIKLRSNCRSILRAVCQVFLRELAENCVEIHHNSSLSTDIDVETVNYAYLKMQSEKTRYTNMGHLFN